MKYRDITEWPFGEDHIAENAITFVVVAMLTVAIILPPMLWALSFWYRLWL